jgi:hypothetical protein
MEESGLCLERTRSTYCSAGRVSTASGVETTVATEVGPGEYTVAGTGVSAGFSSDAVGLVQPARSAQSTSMTVAERRIGRFMQKSLPLWVFLACARFRRLEWLLSSRTGFLCAAGSMRRNGKNREKNS